MIIFHPNGMPQFSCCSYRTLPVVRAPLLFIAFVGVLLSGVQAQRLPDPLDHKEQRRIERGEKRAKALAHIITNGRDSTAAQVRSIYHWVTRHIHYDRRAHRTFAFPTHEVHRTLHHRKATPLGYATLFQRLCDASGIPCKVVLGYAKPADYRIGSRFQRGTHAWNAVQVDGRWQLVDASWGASRLVIRKQPLHAWLWRKFKWAYPRRYRFQRHPVDDWCFMPPDSFRLTHMPIAPAWQLIDTALSLAAFEAQQDSFPPLMQDHHSGIVAMEIGNDAENAIVEAKAGKAENSRDDLDLARAHILLGQMGLRQPPEAGGDTILWKKCSAELVTAKEHLTEWMRQVGKEQRTRMKELRQFERAAKYAILYTRGEWKIVKPDLKRTEKLLAKANAMVAGESIAFNQMTVRVMAPMPRLDEVADSLKPPLKAKLDERIAESHRRAQQYADTVTKYHRRLQTESTRIYIAADTIERERMELNNRVWANLEAIMADSELTFRQSSDTLSAQIRSRRGHRLRHNRLSSQWWRQSIANSSRNAKVLGQVEVARKYIEKLFAEGMWGDSLLARQIYLRQTLLRWREIRGMQASIALMQASLEMNHIGTCNDLVQNTIKPRIAQERLASRYLWKQRRLQDRRFHAEMRLAHHLERRTDEGLEAMRRWISEDRKSVV